MLNRETERLIEKIKHLKAELKRDDLRPQDRGRKEMELRAAIKKLYRDPMKNYHMFE